MKSLWARQKRLNWFARRAEAEAKKDTMPYSERVGNVVAVVVIILVALYFVAHQMWATGFLTSKFGTLEMFLFYGVIIYNIPDCSNRLESAVWSQESCSSL